MADSLKCTSFILSVSQQFVVEYSNIQSMDYNNVKHSDGVSEEQTLTIHLQKLTSVFLCKNIFMDT